MNFSIRGDRLNSANLQLFRKIIGFGARALLVMNQIIRNVYFFAMLPQIHLRMNVIVPL